MDWVNLATSASTPLQVLGKAVGGEFGDAAPTWPSMSLDLSPWDIGFDLTESDFMFAHKPASGILPPDTNTPSSYLSHSPPSTVSSDYNINNLETPEQSNANIIDDSTALMELSKMNIDLHTRVSAAKMSKSQLTFNDLVYRQGPLYIDNYTLAQFMLQISQSFLQVITRLLSAREGPGNLYSSPIVATQISELLSLNYQSKPQQTNQIKQPSYSPPSYNNDPSEPLPAPLALIITSIFIQLISLYELVLEYTTARVDRITIEPVSPVPILFHDGLTLESMCLQGALYSRAVVHVLERMQCVLGIESGPSPSQKRLLTAKQTEMLWSELENRRAIIPSQAVMGPAILRRLFGKMTVAFEHIAAGVPQS
jgi:hypothetical protein